MISLPHKCNMSGRIQPWEVLSGRREEMRRIPSCLFLFMQSSGFLSGSRLWRRLIYYSREIDDTRTVCIHSHDSLIMRINQIHRTAYIRLLSPSSLCRNKRSVFVYVYECAVLRHVWGKTNSHFISILFFETKGFSLFLSIKRLPVKHLYLVSFIS